MSIALQSAPVTTSEQPGSKTPANLRDGGAAPSSGRPAKGVRGSDSLADLAALAAKGDRAAFESIHRRLSPGIHRLFLERASGRGELADDLSQRTWLASWESLQKGRYDPARSAITTFIYAVAYKMWLQWLRTASRPEKLVPDVFESVSPDASSPDFEATAAELLTAVRRCLHDEGEASVLTDEERGIMRATASGASDREIAKDLKVAASTLNARKQAAFDKIRRFLAGLGHRGESTERGSTRRE
ncbi:MAG: RNA polymerase sigma factor [Phycisphaerae bacterium]|jgi:RNA polymerase sigma-70 factor (ECF subfamily)